MQLLRRPVAALTFAVLGVLALAGPALADFPRPWQMGMQTPASPVAVQIEWLHNMVLIIITAICLFVGGLLAYVVWRYSAEKNPNPSQTSHNTVIEVLWTVIPVLILVVIAIPSFRLVYFQDRVPAGNADITLKVTGRQWYWDYSYPDSDNLSFSSYMIPTADLKAGEKRLLEVDNQVVLPVGKNVRILTTSADVIHSFYIPSLGVQRYAIPGRTIETWVRVDRPGTYYGQCNQICGTNHSFMPIVIRAVPEAEFTAWVAEAKKKFADNGSGPNAAAPAAASTTVLAQARD
jgi:cytochrome c oxidase subunit 2